MKTGTLILILLALVVLLIGAISFFDIMRSDGNDLPDRLTENERVVNDFVVKVRNETIAEVGQPIEGFEPSMFMQAFPGLTESDFDGVAAFIGGYEFENGQLIYDLKGEQELHSAARAISDEGMATLLANVRARLNIEVEDEADVDRLIAAINEGGETQIEEVTLTGTIVCLPHKDRTGPQTLECAFGLQADGGEHYGLRNLNFPGTPGGVDTGNRVRVVGELTAPEPTNIYDIVGVVNVSTVDQL